MLFTAGKIGLALKSTHGSTILLLHISSSGDTGVFFSTKPNLAVWLRSFVELDNYSALLHFI